jgi:hypothetical protein
MKYSLILFVLFFINVNTFGQAPTVQITQEEAEKGQEAFATSVATQTYLYGLPMVLDHRFMNVMRNLVKKGEDPNFPVQFANVARGLFFNTWIHTITLPSHQLATLATPNDETIYSIFFSDLRQEPIVLTIPPITDRYFAIALGDAFVENTGYIGTSQGDVKGGSYMLVSPDWKGQKPKNVKKVIRMRYNMQGFISRIQVRDKGADLKKAQLLQAQIKAESLSKFLGASKEDNFAPLEVFPNPEKALDWYAYLFSKLKINKPLPEDRAVIKSLKSLGIDVSKDVNVNALPDPVKKGLEKGYQAGQDALSWFINRGPEKTDNNWFLSFERGRPEQDYLFRAYYCKIGMYTNLMEEAMYPQTISDSKGEKLTGKYSYQLTIPKDKVGPVDAFWSMITYQGSDFVPNKYYHYSVGDQKAQPVKRNADGSVTIMISHEPPNGELSNWLPAPEEGKDFRIVYRMYIPKKNLLTKEGLTPYLPPVIRI